MENTRQTLLASIIYRLAVIDDIHALIALSSRWERAQVITTQNGFLRVAYDYSTFEYLINDRCIIVAYDEQLVGYYLINSHEEHPLINIHLCKVSDLKQNGKLPVGARVGCGAQALIDSDYQGKGIRQELLVRLIDTLKERYDYLYSTISKENPKAFKAHSKDGWQIVGENENYFYATYDFETVKNLKNQLVQGY